MNSSDKGILLLNEYFQRSWLVDRAMTFIAGNDILKDGIFMALL